MMMIMMKMMIIKFTPVFRLLPQIIMYRSSMALLYDFTNNWKQLAECHVVQLHDVHRVIEMGFKDLRF